MLNFWSFCGRWTTCKIFCPDFKMTIIFWICCVKTVRQPKNLKIIFKKYLRQLLYYYHIILHSKITLPVYQIMLNIFFKKYFQNFSKNIFFFKNFILNTQKIEFNGAIWHFPTILTAKSFVTAKLKRSFFGGSFGWRTVFTQQIQKIVAILKPG